MVVEPRLVLVCCDVKYPHATYQCYGEVQMGGWVHADMDFSVWATCIWCGDDNMLFSGPVKVIFNKGEFLLCLTQQESARQMYRKLCKLVVTLICNSSEEQTIT